MADDWITIDDAVNLSGYYPDTLRRLVREGKIKGKKFVTVWQVSKRSLLTYLRSMKEQGEKRGRKKTLDSR